MDPSSFMCARADKHVSSGKSGPAISKISLPLGQAIRIKAVALAVKHQPNSATTSISDDCVIERGKIASRNPVFPMRLAPRFSDLIAI
jgi:hypothetical protein